MTVSDVTIELSGEALTISYQADPAVSRGQFRLENRAAAEQTVALERAWLTMGEHERALEGVSLFDRTHERELDPRGFVVAGGAALELLVGFPNVAYGPPGAACAVGLRLRAGGQSREALSPIHFVRRAPLRR